MAIDRILAELTTRNFHQIIIDRIKSSPLDMDLASSTMPYLVVSCDPSDETPPLLTWHPEEQRFASAVVIYLRSIYQGVIDD